MRTLSHRGVKSVVWLHSYKVVERDLNTGLLILETEPGGWWFAWTPYLSSWQGPSPVGAGEFCSPFSLHLQGGGSLGEEVRARASFRARFLSCIKDRRCAPPGLSSPLTCTWNVDSGLGFLGADLRGVPQAFNLDFSFEII